MTTASKHADSQEVGMTRILAVAYYEAYPCAALHRIAQLVSEATGEAQVSVQRIGQILESSGITRGTNYKQRHYRRFTCNTCGKEFHRRRNLCQKIDRPRAWIHLFCSRECRMAYNRGTFQCDICGKEFQRRVILIQKNIRNSGQKHIFCGKKCHGIWLGRLRQKAAKA